MPRRKGSIFRTITATAIFIFMEVAALHFLSDNGALQRVWFAGIAHGVQRNVWGWTESVSNYFSLDDQNRELSEENARLREALGYYTDLRSEAAIDSLMGVLPPSGFTHRSAKVIKMSENKQHNYLIIDKGSEDGVSEGDGIVTSHGVVGLVDAVGDHYAYAISLKNKDMSISARIGLDGVSGPLSWDGRSARGAILREIPLQHQFHPGDTVYTSSHSARYPSDIPIGTIVESRIVNGATFEIQVEMFQDFSRLKYVSVVHNSGNDAILQLEKMEENQGEEMP